MSERVNEWISGIWSLVATVHFPLLQTSPITQGHILSVFPHLLFQNYIMITNRYFDESLGKLARILPSCKNCWAVVFPCQLRLTVSDSQWQTSHSHRPWVLRHYWLLLRLPIRCIDLKNYVNVDQVKATVNISPWRTTHLGGSQT